jgi:hypothetical protein
MLSRTALILLAASLLAFALFYSGMTGMASAPVAEKQLKQVSLNEPIVLENSTEVYYYQVEGEGNASCAALEK